MKADPYLAYDQATRQMLHGVLDRAWTQLRSANLQAGDPSNATAARQELSARIAEAYEEGERNPEAIKLFALKAFDRWLNSERISREARRTGYPSQ